MTAAGFPPDSIDTVLCTHLHVDHVGWNTNWRRQMGADLRQRTLRVGKTNTSTGAIMGTSRTGWRFFNDSVKPIVDAGKADLVIQRRRFEADEIALISTAGPQSGPFGHSRPIGRRRGLLTGDVAHHPCQMAHLDWS